MAMASTILMRRQGASFSQFPSWCCSKLSFSSTQAAAAAAPPVMFNKWVLGSRPFLHFKLSRAVARAADTRIPSNTVKVLALVSRNSDTLLWVPFFFFWFPSVFLVFLEVSLRSGHAQHMWNGYALHSAQSTSAVSHVECMCFAGST